MQRKLIIISFFMVFTFGCGKQTTHRILSEQSWDQTEVGWTPISLVKQDDICGESFSDQTDILITLEQYFNAGPQETMVNFSSQMSGNYLESPDQKIIKGMFYGSEKYYLKKEVYDESSKDYSSKGTSDIYFLEKGKRLNICAETQQYKKNSYENAGLNISYSINKAYHAVKNAMPSLDLKPVDVYVAPTIYELSRHHGGEKDGTEEYKILTDNAFYYSKQNLIAFLPESKEKRTSAPLWELPMVGAHEYGHHVFHSLVGKYYKENSSHGIECFKDYHETTHISVDGADRLTGPKAFTLRAINEGFADLVANYSLNSKEVLLQGIWCMEDTRDLNYSVYGDGTPKVFSEAARLLMNSKTNHKPPKSCRTPNFQRIHHVGALFAHIADRMLNRVWVSKERKLKSLIKYMKSHGERLTTISNLAPTDYLFVTLQRIYKSALQDKGVYSPGNKKQYCGQLKEYFEDYEKNCEEL